MKSILFIVILMLLLTACSMSNEEIEDYNWKYGEGYYIGDWVYFESANFIRNDTMFLQDSAVAMVIEAFKRIDGSEVMEIQSLKTKETGFYFAK